MQDLIQNTLVSQSLHQLESVEVMPGSTIEFFEEIAEAGRKLFMTFDVNKVWDHARPWELR